MQLLLWKSAGKEVILLGDFNGNVYTARFAKHLVKDDLRMSEQCLKTNGVKLPGTFVTGTQPIDGCFATAGVECTNTCILPRYVGIGDHRCFILDFTSASLLGDVFPKIVTAKGRKLHCQSERLIRNYNKVLNQLCDRHQIFKKLLDIRKLSPLLTTSEFLLLVSKWDKEFEDYMRSAENQCNSFKDDCIEWSPKAGVWVTAINL